MTEKRTTPKLNIIHSLDEIPDFDSEDAERDWWAEHDLSKELYDSLPDMTAELDGVFPLPEKSRQAKAKR